MDNAKKELIDKIKTANNILVTVSRDPTVDQLASCLGLALMLNKQGKHTAAVFSGQVPSTLEFLKPEDTLEKNTDSLRDFIIALDKSKADKLRYKVEDNVVRIFITPYKTSISEADLEFSQGDFNVDLVVALGVERQEDLDEAITAHGRILHDATVASINITPEGGLGSINWHNSQASCLSELITDLARALDPLLLDEQIATALLTGIVSATDRFSNDKTSSQTMSASATLMAAGANQQLVASKLEEPVDQILAAEDEREDVSENNNQADNDEKPPGDDGTIEIEHKNESNDENEVIADQPMELPIPGDMNNDDTDNTGQPTQDGDKLNTDRPPAIEHLTPTESSLPPHNPEALLPSNLSAGSKLLTGPPSLGGTLTANSQPEALDPVTDPLSLPNNEAPMLERNQVSSPTLTPAPANWADPITTPLLPSSSPLTPTPATLNIPTPTDHPDGLDSLSDIEAEVKKSETGSSTNKTEGLDSARDEVDRALSTAEATPTLEPIEALNAQPLLEDLHPSSNAPLPTTVTFSTPPLDTTSTQQPVDNISPSASPLMQSLKSDQPAPKKVTDSNAPPPVPPPIPFQFGNPNPPQ